MTADGDTAKLIAKALKFLANGFLMASESGVAGLLKRVDGGASSSPYAVGLPKTIRVSCAAEVLQLDRFSARLPMDFFLDSIGRGTTSTSISEKAGSVHVRSGLAAGDGAEIYRLRRVDITYSDAPGGFSVIARMQLGEPVANTFVYAAAIDRSDEIYEATFAVAFEELFRFLFPVTKALAEALVPRIFEKSGIKVEMPSFYVNK